MKIRKIEFGEIGFRMLKNMEVNISDRITVIAGHNGIGKSTILGLIANGSELKKKDGETCTGGAFHAYFHELFILDEEQDYTKDRNIKQSFNLIYDKADVENLVKTCNVSRHTEKNCVRLKIVPRGSQEGWEEVGSSAKVIIPTLYLSMSRMVPLGDKPENLDTASYRVHEEDKAYIKEKFKMVISNNIIDESSNVTKHEVKGTKKKTFTPDFSHSTKTISLGQDSLSSIITAFASFNKLKRIQGDSYKGGILLIDEIDAGFHPKAQQNLVRLIKEEAKNLKLQVIVTSHSLTLIKEVLNISDQTARSGRNIDSVVYIMNYLNPRLMTSPTYHKVKNDMLSIIPKEENKPQIKIYFEDLEAYWFFKEIMKYEDFKLENMYTNYEFVYVPTKLGCENLIQLKKADTYFNTVVIIFDNDIMSKQTSRAFVEANDNIICLPAIVENENVSATERTPEYQIYKYIGGIINTHDHSVWSNCPDAYHSQIIKEIVVDTFPVNISDPNTKLRDWRKNWFIENTHHFEQLEIMKYFRNDNPEKITIFVNDLKTAVDATIKQMSN